MGTYVNIGNEAFASIRNGEYTDKSGLIDVGVIYLDMTDFSLRFSDTEDVVDVIQQDLKEDLLQAFPAVKEVKEKDSFLFTLLKIAEQTFKIN